MYSDSEVLKMLKTALLAELSGEVTFEESDLKIKIGQDEYQAYADSDGMIETEDGVIMNRFEIQRSRPGEDGVTIDFMVFENEEIFLRVASWLLTMVGWEIIKGLRNG